MIIVGKVILMHLNSTTPESCFISISKLVFNVKNNLFTTLLLGVVLPLIGEEVAFQR